MKKLLILAALAAICAGCSVTKVNYKKDADGVCEYRIYHNDHWLERETGAMSGGMTTDGKFEVKLESATVSPSEEFNKSMQTYTTAFVQLAQIAAAAYNPSASAAAAKSESSKAQGGIMLLAEQGSTEKSATSDPHSAECADGSCTTGACTDGNCSPEAK